MHRTQKITIRTPFLARMLFFLNFQRFSFTIYLILLPSFPSPPVPLRPASSHQGYSTDTHTHTHTHTHTSHTYRVSDTWVVWGRQRRTNPRGTQRDKGNACKDKKKTVWEGPQQWVQGAQGGMTRAGQSGSTQTGVIWELRLVGWL